MKGKISLILGMTFSLIFISAGLLFSQEQEIPSQSEADIQWVWGEVASLDLTTKQMVVKYLDYETDGEKEMSIIVDDKTIYENVKSIEEIKSLDIVSVDYIIDPKGANIARNISVEKPEGQETLQDESIEGETKVAPGLE